ncbi:MAG: hypothetical protein ACRDP9_20725 [Kribbellaceae bacterium]
MTIDIDAAKRFLNAHGRLLDRRRFELLTGNGDPAAVRAAVDGYRNPDGGYGWGLEPDLRDKTSQPGAALHAFEAFADAAPATTGHAAELCDWLDTITLPDGGVPFALPVEDPAGTAPFWATADSSTSSLQITAVVTVNALRLARHDPAVAKHPWLARATSYCVERIAIERQWGQAIELCFALQLLDALTDERPKLVAELERVGAMTIPPSGVLHVAGGLPEEVLRPLDFAPYPDRSVRALFRPDVVATDLERVAAEQQADGGWEVDFASYSPAAALEWRGYRTVWAVGVLLANGLVNGLVTRAR